MKVKDVMTRSPVRCRPTTDIHAAAHLMWEGDFGVLPVVNDDDEVAGLVTDRDIAMAVGTSYRPSHEMMVQDVMSRSVVQCSAADALTSALALMKEHQLHRLPVTRQGKLQGMVSLNDIVLEGKDVTSDEILDTLRAVGRHRKVLQEA